MAETIIDSLRALANKIETLGEGADECIKKDKGLASDFRELLKLVPAAWRRDNENRLFSQIKKNTNYNNIQGCHRKVIWSWKESHEGFCLRQDRNTVDSRDTSALDGLIGGIESDDTDLVLSSVHWRISLLIITLVKDLVCKDTTDPEEIAKCFQSNGLVSARKFNYLKNNVCLWEAGGAKYKDISLRLGGYGSLIYLPDIGRTNYEVHYFPTRDSAYSIIGVLTPSIAPVASQKFDGFNAHNVVDAIVQSTIDRIKDVRLLIIPVRFGDTQQSKRTSRAEKSRVRNQYSQSRKRTHQNSQATPGSKIRRVDVRRAGTGAATVTNCDANTNDENIGARQSDPSAEGAVSLPSLTACSSHAAGTPILDRRISHPSSVEAGRSRNSSVSAAAITNSSTGAAETTLNVGDEGDTMSSEATSIISMSATAQQSTSVQTNLGAFESDQEWHSKFNTHFNLDTFNFLDHDYTQFNLDTFNFLDHDYTQFNLDTFNFQEDESTEMQIPIASPL